MRQDILQKMAHLQKKIAKHQTKLKIYQDRLDELNLTTETLTEINQDTFK